MTLHQSGRAIPLAAPSDGRPARPIPSAPAGVAQEGRKGDRAAAMGSAADDAGAGPAARRFVATVSFDLAAIATEWEALQDGGDHTVYQHRGWVEPIVRHLASRSKTPCFVVLREAATGAVSMIWPFALVRRFGFRTLQWLDLGVSDYAAPVVAAGLRLTDEEAGLAWAAVKAALPRADVIRIERIPRLVGATPNPLAALPGTRASALHASGVALEGTPDTLLKRLAGKSTFRDITKTRNRLQEIGALSLVVADTDAAVDATFDTLLAHRHARFRKLGRFDLLTRPAVADFYREAAKANRASGRVRLFGLSVGGTIVATSYCLAGGGAMHGILLSMSDDEALRRCSPGLLLAAENMAWARAQGFDYFDFTIGDLPYKGGLGGAHKEILDFCQALTPAGSCLLAGAGVGRALREEMTRRPALMARLKALRRAMRRASLRGMLDRLVPDRPPQEAPPSIART